MAEGTHIGPKDSLVLGSAAAASYAASEMLRCLNEHDELPDELLEQLLDAAKMLIEAEEDSDTEERGAVYVAICRFLTGWAPSR